MPAASDSTVLCLRVSSSKSAVSEYTCQKFVVRRGTKRDRSAEAAFKASQDKEDMEEPG